MTGLERRVWAGDAWWALAARTALLPVAAAYGTATAIRNAMFDRGMLASRNARLPVLSVGNLSVGGTGKTPVSAWIAGRLREANARPALVMRGYGSDEPLVHRLLNPDVPVYVNADRLAAIEAAADAGCDVAVLDDGFQHRRVRREEDVVLASAEQWTEPIRLLPAGPWREGAGALARATLVIVTRRIASPSLAESLMRRLSRLTRRGEGAVVSLGLGALRDAVTGEEQPLSCLQGESVLAVAGVGDPRSFGQQLAAAGARVTFREFPDHHVYGSADAVRLGRDATSHGRVVCTMKDAVKLGPLWPREAGPLWYVSLRCEVEAGGAEVSALLARVLAARQPHNI